ncbi:MAG: regulatory protein MerR [Amycolatopsis sp.]|uniref:MerR family transcriptional regulator n=1 Tax=Amycolatopsis sp. TaxID=37632 RepID=UPI00262250C9|nr:MerR family transcriptional regulator [Amycolatopsis sp.]MCU1680606.1 regulatory protein MerR [Amycolatopsis sp.]
MGLLTIGAFARAARLTPKALRLYDKLGLLRPAVVDPESGYRFYDADQLDQARLIAQLRRIGMPLAEIGTVCRMEAAAAAEVINTYWQRVTADTTARGRLATFLVDHLSGRGTTMSKTNPTLAIRYAAHCDTGSTRDSNEDAVHASDRLLAVADGMRGPGGAAASAAAIDALTALELVDAPAAELLTMLASAVAEADRAVRQAATEDDQPVTTLTAILRSGSQLALVHIGDTRAYLLRGCELFQLTQDHSYVQSLVDQGKLDRAEAASHPQRALLVRALGAGGHDVEADLALRTALPGDRYLLCSDGLSAVVDREALHTALTTAAAPERTVQQLMDLAYAQGAPDNIACVIADMVAV